MGCCSQRREKWENEVQYYNGLTHEGNRVIILYRCNTKRTLEDIWTMESLSIFKEMEIQNKEELLLSLKSLYAQYLSDHTGITAQRVLMEKFMKHIEAMLLPKCDDWWFYRYDFTRFGMILEMCHCSKFEAESDETTIMTVDASIAIAEVTCDMMSVADFARLHNVQPVAVRQWIRRGKLRPIQKQGRDWLIASIAAPPTRHYISVIYEWDQIDRELYKMFPYLKGVSTVQITQNIDDKALFDLWLGERIQMSITSKEREKLELALLAVNDIDVYEER